MYGVAAPLVHMSHGQIGKGPADFALRVGLPTVLGFLAERSAPALTARRQADDHPPPPPVQATSRIEPASGVAPEGQGGARATVGVVGTF
jgi:hypothetical protein